MSAFRDRVLTAMRHGARRLDIAKWRGLVEEAAKLLEKSHSSLSEFAVCAPSKLPKSRIVDVRSTQMVVDAQLLLDLERALAEAEMLRVELEEMAAEEITRWRDARIRRQLDEAIVRVQQRLLRESS